ncbi:hypothetical protein BN10_1230003 [Phycicoccus elongatus Lp2]|uniref:ABC3 transporter permease C-terminal domain-containing protein n=1 Tax=Phycicoccus elongatus Lp2 TaxID=1193181 RepID=N0DZT2_9MICO|nr:FtsX-like permease family protein [Phycicoccus elongatus]CCH68895.1 hypothetical protein BN10_1230003 [Phycicoccus elongatus Lp2]
MAVCAVLLVATTVRLSAFVRRREIGIMRLVGASSSWSIRLPFLLEVVIVATLIGVALAVGVLWGFLEFVLQGSAVREVAVHPVRDDRRPAQHRAARGRGRPGSSRWCGPW